MNHAIIGLAQTGAACLGHIDRLLTDNLPENTPSAALLLYCQSRADAPENCRFLPTHQCFTFHSTAAARKECEQLLQNYGGMDKVGAVYRQSGSRRENALRFRLDSTPLQQALHQFAVQANNTRTVFHIIADGTQPADSAILLELLVLLRRQYPEAETFVYLFAENNLSDDIRAAAWYATALECNIATANRVNVCYLPYSDSQTLDSEARACAYQISHATITVPLATGLTENGNPAFNAYHFCHMQELAVCIDRKKMATLLAQQMGMIMAQRMISSEDEDKTAQPAWVDELFSDKKWLLHPDFLSMDQDISGTRALNAYSSIEREWESRSRFFLEKVNPDTEWDEQINTIAAAQNDVYLRLFRGQGVELFYAVNESGVTAMAQRVVSQIEIELAGAWCENQYTFTQIQAVCEKIASAIDRRLSVCRNRRQQQGDIAKKLTQEHRDLLAQWVAASRAQRRKIQKAYPVEEVARQLTQQYIADCHAKAMTFACRLLLSVIAELDNLQKRISQVVEQSAKNAQIGKIIPSRAEYDTILAVDGEEAWKLWGETDWISIMPSNFAQSLDKLYTNLRADCFATVKPEKGFSGILEHLSDENLMSTITEKIMARHPIFRPNRFEAAHNVFFWHLIFYIQAQIQAASTRISGTKISAHTKHIWLLPANGSDKDTTNRLAGALSEAIPGSRVLINVAMPSPCLIFRSMALLPVRTLDHLAAAEQAYNRLLLGNDGAAHSLLLHTQNKTPYPEYDSTLLAAPKPDDVRLALLTGVLRGTISEMTAKNGQTAVYLHFGGTQIALGENLPDAQTHMNPSRFKLLQSAVSARQQDLSPDEIRQILSNYLEKIKIICLNGKTDIRRADWKEAGNYMPWARIVESLAAHRA